VTLSEQGWIQAREDQMTRGRFPSSPRIAIARAPSPTCATPSSWCSSNWATQTGETAIFNERMAARLVVSQVAESKQPLRMAPRIGTVIPARDSATGRILLPFLSRERQVELLGEPPDAAFLDLLRHMAARAVMPPATK